VTTGSQARGDLAAAGRVEVAVVVPAALRDDAGGASVVRVMIESPDIVAGTPSAAPAGPPGARPTVRQVLDALAGSHPRLERRLRDERGAVRRHVNVFVGPDDSRGLLGQDTVVPAGAEILVLPNVAGG
jgi:molybdopterin converting factor small subunit